VIVTPQEQMFNDVTPVKRQDGIGGSRLFCFLPTSHSFLKKVMFFYLALTFTL
jgi:hypothetical protein